MNEFDLILFISRALSWVL